jgi:hypothetical protein
LGWVAILFPQIGWLETAPLEFYSPEAFGFLGVFSLPHLAVARGFLFLGIAFHMKSMKEANKQYEYPLLAGLCWLTAGLFQPLEIIFSYLYLIIFSGIHMLSKENLQQSIKKTLIAFLLPAPIFLYTFISMIIDPFYKAWTAQNIIKSPDPVYYLLAYCIYLIPSILGTRTIIINRDKAKYFMFLWVLLFPF